MGFPSILANTATKHSNTAETSDWNFEGSTNGFAMATQGETPDKLSMRCKERKWPTWKDQ